MKWGTEKWFEIYVNDRLWAGFKMLNWAEKMADLLQQENGHIDIKIVASKQLIKHLPVQFNRQKPLEKKEKPEFSFVQNSEISLFDNEASPEKKQKFYAVRVGFKKGVYTTWNQCRKQTEGFPNARFKAFESREEAKRWVKGEG